MQKIFYNARFLTMNEKFEEVEAMLTNDENIVFVGSKDEVLQMKMDETELVDLNGKMVIPTFYGLNLDIYLKIEEELKNAKKDKFIEKEAQNDENYEKFENFDIYKKEFLKIQDKLFSYGVTTIQENISSREEFCFWKKMAESGELKIDVIGYVDFLKNKQIMDDNCRSYRKYKNHFRLGGYYICLDGSILEKKAWLKKPYPKEKGYAGFFELGGEQLKFIIKTVLEEKKQLVVHASGDRAVEEFLLCYEEQTKESPVEDNFRPIISGCNFVSKKLLKKMNELNIVPSFDVFGLSEQYDVLKSYFGKCRLKKIVPLKACTKLGQKFLTHKTFDEKSDSISLYNELSNLKSKTNKIIKNKIAFSQKELFDTLILSPAYYCFDLEQKGSFESGKRANFLVIKNDINEHLKENEIEEIYLDAESVYKFKAKKK